MAERRPEHTSVLVEAVLDAIAGDEPRAALVGDVVDATIGAGGHARALLEAFPGLRLIGVDRDAEALELARRELEPFGDRAVLVQARHSELTAVLERVGGPAPLGLLLDLGVSSMQFDRAERGFSCAQDGPLDMRMGDDEGRTAADLVNAIDEQDLADLIFHEGGEHRSRRIAAAIIQARRNAPFLRTMALAETIERAVGGRRGARTHPATRTFQALRRAVNQEGEELRQALLLAEAAVAPGGRLVCLTFHSGEDGQVKRFLARGVSEGRWSLCNAKPLQPTRAEVRANPRSRSARLRAAVRCSRSQQGGTE